MAEKIFEYHPSSAISLNIEDFNGPIDLLYQLIVADGRYEIKDFPLHLVTYQFISYLSQLTKLEMDVASDFVKIATDLLRIKSAAVLIKEEDVEIEDDVDYDAEKRLHQRLLAYALVQKNLAELKIREKIYQINRKPKYTDADAIIVIDKFNMHDLIDAYGQVLMRIGEKEESMRIKKVPRDRYPVFEQLKLVTSVLKEKKKVGFYELMSSSTPEKGEIISTFQALLSLMKKQIAFAEQEGDSEIQVTLNPEYEEKEIDISSITSEDV